MTVKGSVQVDDLKEFSPTHPQPYSARQPSWIREGMKLGNVYHFRKKNPFFHNLINLSTLFVLLMGCVGVAYLSKILKPILFLPLGILALGLLSFSLFILVVHEASHNMFVISRNRKRALFWNRLLGWSLSLPMGIHYQRFWEEGHHIHHVHPIEPQDPQNCRPLTGLALFRWVKWILLIPAFGFYSHFYCPAAQPHLVKWYLTLATFLFWGIFGMLSILYLSWTLPVAALVSVRISETINQFKIAMEHGGEIGRENNPFLRSCSSFFPLRWLFMPFNISLHFEHHLHYCVPWYDLMKFHKGLLKIVPLEFQPYFFHHRGEVWKQIQGKFPTIPAHLRSFL